MPLKNLGCISKSGSASRSPETLATGMFNCLKNETEDETIEEVLAVQKTMDERGNNARRVCALERRREITMDSAAETSVCLPEWGKELFGFEAVGEGNKLKLDQCERWSDS